MHKFNTVSYHVLVLYHVMSNYIASHQIISYEKFTENHYTLKDNKRIEHQYIKRRQKSVTIGPS